MLCCDCIKKIEKLEATKEDFLLVKLNKTLMQAQVHALMESLDKTFKNKIGKIVLVPNIVDIKIGKYTDLEAIKKQCERMILECDEVISRRCMPKDNKKF